MSSPNIINQTGQILKPKILESDSNQIDEMNNNQNQNIQQKTTEMKTPSQSTEIKENSQISEKFEEKSENCQRKLGENNENFIEKENLKKDEQMNNKIEKVIDLKIENEKNEIDKLKNEQTKSQEKIKCLQEKLENQAKEIENQKEKIETQEKKLKDEEKKKMTLDNTIKNKEEKIKELEEKNFDLDKIKKEQETKIRQLESEIQKNTDLFNQLNEKNQKLESLKEDNLSKEKTIEEKKKEIDNKSAEIEQLSAKNQNLENMLISKDNEIEKLKDEVQKNSKIIEDQKHEISEMKKNVQLKQSNENINPLDFYDIIVHIDSLIMLNQKGWKLETSKSFAQMNYQKKACVIGVVGNANMGKSFVLSKLSQEEFPSGFNVRTEGLSIKYPNSKSKHNVILLDTAGLETPLTKAIINDDENLEENARDKQLTEWFLQKFVIDYSDILIAVVGQLSFSEQKFLSRLQESLKKMNKKLIIIHNLSKIMSISFVQNYIIEVIKNSSTFNVEENEIPKIEENTINSNQFNHYFKEIDYDIVHLIMANENSEAGKYYNNSSIKYLISIVGGTHPNEFNLLNMLYSHLINTSQIIFEEILTIEDLSPEVTNFINPIKIRNKKIELKKCLVDELGFSQFYSKKGFEPKYVYYIEDDKLKVNVEMVRKAKLQYDIKNLGDGKYYLLRIKGETVPEEMKNKSLYYSTRDKGNFSLIIHIPNTEKLKYLNTNGKLSKKEGLITIEFQINSNKQNGEETLIL